MVTIVGCGRRCGNRVFTALVLYAKLVGVPRRQRPGRKRQMTIESVRQSVEGELLRLPNVVAVGIGEKGGRPVIQVGVTRKVPASQLRKDQLIPPSRGGYDIEVVELGQLVAEEGRDED
jgi:hypothetical protein